MSKSFSQSDVAAHKKPDDLWIIVDEDVYDLTKFQMEHPGKSQCSKSRLLMKELKYAGGQKSKLTVFLRKTITR